MKLFQQLLVAPAALGLMAPLAVSAAELNLDGVNQYSSEEQVTSVDQLSDVRPTDWAYQALSNLIERYGCVAGYPDGTYRGGQAMTRYEAAALLNACLDRVTEITDELKRLMKEFEKELAILRGRVDGLEAKVGELEATQFSTTTKLKGYAAFVIGGNTYSGNSYSSSDSVSVPRAYRNDGDRGTEKVSQDGLKRYNQEQYGAFVFNYDVRIDFDTSFTGKDLFRTRLRAGNFAGSPYGGGGGSIDGDNYRGLSGLQAMETAFESDAGNDVVEINRLFYQFPIGSSFTATIGGRVRQDDMLAMWPSAYPADTVLDFFTYAGAPAAYNLNLGGGGGLWWKSGGWSVSLNYVSANSDNGNTTSVCAPGVKAASCGGGIGNSTSAETGTAQIGYAGDNWGIAAAYNYSTDFQGGGLYSGNGTPLAVFAGQSDSTNSVGVSAYWQPTNPGWIPSISLGWGINKYNDNDSYPIPDKGLDGAESQSWYVGLQWDDAFIKGNALGMAVGQPTFLTDYGDDGADYFDTKGSNPNDGQYAWEWWYKFQVTDNISVTPAIYYLSAPLGQFGKTNEGDSFDNFGGLIKTTFRF